VNEFASRNRRGATDHGDEIAFARTFTRRTQNSFSSLWNVTRSTRPAKTSGLLFVVDFKAAGPELIRLLSIRGFAPVSNEQR
jgi:hypothetical protein